jgi:hypothetical protein
MMIVTEHSEPYEIKTGDVVVRSDRLGPEMIVDDVFKEADIVWIKFECDKGESTWSGALFVLA